MLSRLLGVFMPYDAMYHHAKFVLNENREGMEVMNEWKKARLEELNFVGIVVRLAPIDRTPRHFLHMACTDIHVGCSPRLGHHLNPNRLRYSHLAYPRSMSLSPDFRSHFHLHRHTTDNYPHKNVLRPSLRQEISTSPDQVFGRQQLLRRRDRNHERVQGESL
jgi:hypothetical protein